MEISVRGNLIPSFLDTEIIYSETAGIALHSSMVQNTMQFMLFQLFQQMVLIHRNTFTNKSFARPQRISVSSNLVGFIFPV